LVSIWPVADVAIKYFFVNTISKAGGGEGAIIVVLAKTKHLVHHGFPLKLIHPYDNLIKN
jgi:hypothetical protein